MPSQVRDVVGSSGQALDENVRQWAEPRIGHALGDVRVHTDQLAAESAGAIDALAYTVNRHVVFGERQYQPSTRSGRKLIAHELAHVAQQSSGVSPSPARGIGPSDHPTEIEADRIAEAAVSSDAPAAPSRIQPQPAGLVARQTSPAANCGAGANGAPANFGTILDTTELFALLATVAADADLNLLQLDAMLPGLGAQGGYTMPTGRRMAAYTARFGLPSPAAGGQFRNRLSGATFPSRAEALVNEAQSLQDRYSRIGDFVTGSSIAFRCITNPTTVGTCTGTCVNRSATGCFGGIIMLCPRFWTFTPGVRALLLIHEVAHVLFSILHDHNFRHADCYAAYAADAQGTASQTTPACVA